MPEGAATSSARRFAADLRAIREARDVTLEDLHGETKIPGSLLAAFEETGLFDHPMFNRVYLRSFVRTYAEVIGIAPEVALASLEEALSDTYQGRLGQEYLQRQMPEAAPMPGPGEPGVPVPEQVRTGEPVQVPEQGEAPASRRAPAGRGTASPRPPSARPARTPPPPRRGSLRPAPRRPEEAPASRQWIYIGVGVVVLGFLVWLLFRSLERPEPMEPTVAAVDTAAVVEDTTSAPAEPAAAAAPPVVLGDTMHVEIVAANGPVQNIKVRVDEDLRRPYWIEEGESTMFPVTDQIIIEQQLGQIAIEIEDHTYPFQERIDEQGRVVITRADVQSFFDAMAGR